MTPLPTWLHTIHHDSSEKYVDSPAPRLGDTVQVRLRTGADAPLRAVYLRTLPDGEQALTPMTAVSPASPSDPIRWWVADLPINQPLVHYRFILVTDEAVWFYSAAGPSAAVPLDATDFRLVADYQAPPWLATAVFYQIFPDRFANGDPTNDPQPHEFQYNGFGPTTYPWQQPAPPEQPSPLIFYGGDLAGVAQRLDYLADLGVTALYFNPLFTAPSNHKYDVTDYENIDPHLGGNEALAALRQALDARGMRYLLDIVPNHCGYWHPWFQAARADADAPEADFFTFFDHPDAYAHWLMAWTLPKLNYQSVELRRRIYAGDDAIMRRWLRPPFSADGWRVDVANMLGRQGEVQMNADVIRGIRRAVKAARPDAYLMGEHFFDASSQLQGDQWDGVMNYAGLTMPLWHWLRGYEQGAHGLDDVITAPPITTAALAATWQQHLAAIPWAIACQQYNVLGSHDVARIHTVVGENEALHRLAAVVQFTFPGVPCIYYGDEIGMVDAPGFGSRGCMIWDEAHWHHDLRAFYQQLIRLRRETAVLQRGGFQMLAVEPDSFVYQREGTDGRILVSAHRGGTPRPAGPLPVAHGGIPDGARFVEYFSGIDTAVANGALSLPAQPQGATLWRQV